MIHKEVGVQSSLKVIVSLLASQFSSPSQVESAIKAIDYAGKKCLRLRGTITGKGVIMGNVMVLDLNIPLDTTNSHDVTLRHDEFNREVVKNLTQGVYHSTDEKSYGGFGRLNVGYVSPEAAKEAIFTVRVKTMGTVNDVRNALSKIGTVQEVRDATGRFS